MMSETGSIYLGGFAMQRPHSRQASSAVGRPVDGHSVLPPCTVSTTEHDATVHDAFDRT